MTRLPLRHALAAAALSLGLAGGVGGALSSAAADETPAPDQPTASVTPSECADGCGPACTVTIRQSDYLLPDGTLDSDALSAALVEAEAQPGAVVCMEGMPPQPGSVGPPDHATRTHDGPAALVRSADVPTRITSGVAVAGGSGVRTPLVAASGLLALLGALGLRRRAHD
jgi:hypothetical protein